MNTYIIDTAHPLFAEIHADLGMCDNLNEVHGRNTETGEYETYDTFGDAAIDLHNAYLSRVVCIADNSASNGRVYIVTE